MGSSAPGRLRWLRRDGDQRDEQTGGEGGMLPAVTQYPAGYQPEQIRVVYTSAVVWCQKEVLRLNENL